MDFTSNYTILSNKHHFFNFFMYFFLSEMAFLSLGSRFWRSFCQARYRADLRSTSVGQSVFLGPKTPSPAKLRPINKQYTQLSQSKIFLKTRCVQLSILEIIHRVCVVGSLDSRMIALPRRM